MSWTVGVILCLAYLLGLASSAVPWGGWAVLGLGLLAALGMGHRCPHWLSHQWVDRPEAKVWLVAGVIGLLASFYLPFRTPQPTANDISRLLTPPAEATQFVTVQGEIITPPRLTDSQRLQIWLRVSAMIEGDDATRLETASQPVEGKLYVTMPPTPGQSLYPGQKVAIVGTLYLPQKASNPGGFDFQSYLAQEGGFAGMRGRRVILSPNTRPGWGWWRIRQRMIQAQARGLPQPEAALLSSMVLGSKVVDLDSRLKEQFARVGLAHALAASGFQTSLILSTILALTVRLATPIRFSLGCLGLLTFLGLTGIQPSVLRAVVMGLAALLGLLLQRKVKPLGSILLSAVLILLLNPLWIWDLGFQLSFLATLGLLVTVPALTQKLDWLPGTIVPMLAVPIAAYLWTLPLQLYAFGVVSPYSIPANLLTTPLISILSLGGVISALAAFIWPALGSFTAWLLYYPSHALIWVVESFSQLPGNAVAIGTISLIQLLVLYSLFGLVWLRSRHQRYIWLSSFVAVGLIALPVVQTQSTLVQATLLATGKEPILVLQDRGTTTLINSGSEKTARFTVLPFLKRQGINQIDQGLITEPELSQTGWIKIAEQMPVKALQQDFRQPLLPALRSQAQLSRALQKARELPTAFATQAQSPPHPPIWQFQIQQQSWLLIRSFKSVPPNPIQPKPIRHASAPSPKQRQKKSLQSLMPQKPPEPGLNLPQATVLWWTGEPLTVEILRAIQPKVAIASATSIDPLTLNLLHQRHIQVYWTGRDGALQWRNGSFSSMAETEASQTLL